MSVDAARYLKPFDAFQVDPGDMPIQTVGAVEGRCRKDS